MRRALSSTARCANGRDLLTEPEAKDVLAAYRIPVVRTRVGAAMSRRRCACGAELGFPVALKILSPDITHKSDVGGVALDIGSDARAGERRARSCCSDVASACPLRASTGFTVQTMVKRSAARELIAGITVDPTFGPVILFGQGGIEVEVADDKAIALPPLNTVLAAELISRTRIRRLLGAYRNPAGREHAGARARRSCSLRSSPWTSRRSSSSTSIRCSRTTRVSSRSMRASASLRATGGAADRLAIRPVPGGARGDRAVRGTHAAAAADHGRRISRSSGSF